jgi:hypothetical protein
MGVCTGVYGVAVGILKVSTVVLGSSYLNRLFAALVTTGATKFESPDPIFALGGSSKGFTNWHVVVQSTSALCPRATLVNQSAVEFLSLGMCLKCTGIPNSRFILKIP